MIDSASVPLSSLDIFRTSSSISNAFETAKEKLRKQGERQQQRASLRKAAKTRLLATMTPDSFAVLLNDLQLIHSSLLPTETISFPSSEDDWLAWLTSSSSPDTSPPSAPPDFDVSVSGSPVSFHVAPGSNYPDEAGMGVSVRGDVGRVESEEWLERIGEVLGNRESDTTYPLYELVSLNLLPMLQDHIAAVKEEQAQDLDAVSNSHNGASVPYHALFTSHHLISPTKRRNLQSWSSELSIAGFSKVGYPGLIYAMGRKEDVFEFVRRVKAMQWLALRLRVLGPLEAGIAEAHDAVRWREVEKIGDVLKIMKEWGRESVVLDLGIGAGGADK